MKRKGISPLIAAVLLIAFTMAVASIFAQWAPQLIQDAQGDTSERAESIQDCSGLIVDIVSADAQNATIQQTAGGEHLGDVSVTWFYDDSEPVQDTVSIESSRGSNQTNAGTESGDLTRVTADPEDCEGAPGDTFEP